MAKLITDLSQEFNPVDKPKHKRNKPTAKQRGDISPSVRLKLHQRSKGICEKCCTATAREAAHTLRRWKVKNKTTLEDLCHMCVACHDWADTEGEGRKFLQQFRYSMYRNAGRLHEYYE